MRPKLLIFSMLAIHALSLNEALAQDIFSADFADPQTVLLERAGPRSRAVAPRQDLELALIAGAPYALEVSLSGRAAIGATGPNSGVRHATELRIGRGLLREHRVNPNGSSAYAFVASNRDAVTWRPGARSAFGGPGSAWALQDRVEIGDVAAGVTYERNGVLASLAYVEREESANIGHENFNRDQRFAGLTLTMRH